MARAPVTVNQTALHLAAAAPLVSVLRQRTGNLSPVRLVLAAVALITVGCALLFPNRPEKLQPELWERSPGTLPAPVE